MTLYGRSTIFMVTRVPVIVSEERSRDRFRADGEFRKRDDYRPRVSACLRRARRSGRAPTAKPRTSKAATAKYPGWLIGIGFMGGSAFGEDSRAEEARSREGKRVCAEGFALRLATEAPVLLSLLSDEQRHHDEIDRGAGGGHAGDGVDEPREQSRASRPRRASASRRLRASSTISQIRTSPR